MMATESLMRTTKCDREEGWPNPDHCLGRAPHYQDNFVPWFNAGYDKYREDPRRKSIDNAITFYRSTCWNPRPSLSTTIRKTRLKSRNNSQHPKNSESSRPTLPEKEYKKFDALKLGKELVEMWRRYTIVWTPEEGAAWKAQTPQRGKRRKSRLLLNEGDKER